jgi:cell filamentation protein
MSTKQSIRFYKDREVRAIWNDEQNKWFFSVLDIIGAINEQEDYQKNRNYWKYLKAKLKKEQSELVSATTQLKLLAPDGKRRLADAVDHEGVIKPALTDKIDDRELFMKGIDYSYYYEQEE